MITETGGGASSAEGRRFSRVTALTLPRSGERSVRTRPSAGGSRGGTACTHDPEIVPAYSVGTSRHLIVTLGIVPVLLSRKAATLPRRASSPPGSPHGSAKGARKSPGRNRRGARRRPSWSRPGPRWGLRIATGTSVLLLAAGGVGHAMVTGLSEDVRRVDPFDDLDTDSRPRGDNGVNFLVVGTDRRDGISATQKERYNLGGSACDCTDTMLLVHLSGDRDRATVVSLPRDTYTKLPPHEDRATGKRVAARPAKLNAAYTTRRRPADRAGGGEAHRRARRPLSGGRLHQLHEHGGRPGRRSGLHHTSRSRTATRGSTCPRAPPS